ncbi:hypothetical protein FOZ60_012810 [Perkinsus olseni]|nr:hypothetical protein FOZ60_012810 [Perkinsus olseni]
MPLCYLESPLGTWSLPPAWTRPYIGSLAMLLAFYFYFCWILIKKSFPSVFHEPASSVKLVTYSLIVKD